jgi:hypothetical protein
MTDNLVKKLNTTGAFDTPWLKEQLQNWNVVVEQRKADFMEHMYQCAGRNNGLYSGLWQEFCFNEAGPFARKKYFEMVEAVKLFEQQQTEKETVSVS